MFDYFGLCINTVITLYDFDYIIENTSISGLVFANTILKGSAARIALVDDQIAPGGHWHQLPVFSRIPPPFSSFGLSAYSIQDWRHGLSHTHRDTVLAYCAHVLEHCLLPSGRVSYFPRCAYHGDGKIVSIDTGQIQNATIRRRVVPPTQPARSLSGRHIPCFSYSDPVTVLHPRNVPSNRAFIDRQFDTYCILGAGRMATDAALFLLEEKILPDQIRWVKSRETWALSAPQLAAAPASFKDNASLSLDGLRLMSQMQTSKELCLGLERLGLLLRTSSGVEPWGFSQQIITAAEAARTRTIRGVIRKGHVHAISEIGMFLDQGVVPMPAKTLYIDCTGSLSASEKPPQIFQDGTIHLADVRLCQPSFSAAIIGAIELLDVSDENKNALCAPVYGSDITTLFLTSILNYHAWFHHRALRKWLETCHLDRFLQTAARKINANVEIQADLKTIRAVLPRAIINLERLLEQSGADDPLIG